MLYWTIALSFAFIGTAIAWKSLTYLWNNYDRLSAMAVTRFATFHGFPGHPNYMDLKFSLARHAFVFLVTSAIFYWAKSTVTLDIFYYLSFFYNISLIFRYFHRKKTIKDLSASGEHESLVGFLIKPLKDSKVVIVYSICSELVLGVLLVLRLLSE